MKKEKMNAKKALVSFLAIATLLFLAATVSGAEITDDVTVQIDSMEIATHNGATTQTNQVSVIAGETVSIKVYFTATVPEGNASDVRIQAELEGEKNTVDAETTPFDIEDGKRYVKTLTLVVPYELSDEISDDVILSLKIWNGMHKSELGDITLRVQRPSYNADVKSIIVSNTIEAGQISPVDIVLENIGYNDLQDLYVTVSVSELGISKTSYFGDLVSVGDESNEDTVSGRLYLEIPYDVAPGTYTVEVEVVSDDFSNIVSKPVTIQNGFSELAMRSGNSLLVLNPTNHLRVYNIVYPAEELTVVVQAGSSKIVPIQAELGEYNFDVFVFTGDELVGTVNFSGASEGELTSPVVVLTVILAIVFLVLLVVLVVLITKKPEKTEEFGESYY